MKLTVVNKRQDVVEVPIIMPDGLSGSVLVNPGRVNLKEDVTVPNMDIPGITILDDQNRVYIPGVVYDSETPQTSIDEVVKVVQVKGAKK